MASQVREVARNFATVVACVLLYLFICQSSGPPPNHIVEYIM